MSQSDPNGLRSKHEQKMRDLLARELPKVNGYVFLIELARALAEAQKRKAEKELRETLASEGLVDNAVEYITSNFQKKVVSLLVAPHPTKAGSILLQFAGDDRVYECMQGDAVMLSLWGMTPARTGVFHRFNYRETHPVPESMVSELDEFRLMQCIAQMGIDA
jgi:hypothetical protein